MMEFILPLTELDDHTSVSRKNWKQMKQRFKDYYILKNQEGRYPENGGDRPSSSLLMFISRNKIRDVLQAFSASAEHELSTLEDVFESIEDLYLPNFILLYERFKFFSIKQKQFEDFGKFVSELQILGNFCELGEEHDKLLTSRIVDGVYRETLRSHLQSFSNLELEKAIEVCTKTDICSLDRCMDAMQKDMSSPSPTEVVDSDIFKKNKDCCNNALTENMLPNRCKTRGRRGKSKQNKGSCIATYSKCNEENKPNCRENAQISTPSQRHTRSSSLRNNITLPTRTLRKKRLTKSVLEASLGGGNDESCARSKSSDSTEKSCQQQPNVSSQPGKIVGHECREATTVLEQDVNATFVSRNMDNNDICSDTEITKSHSIPKPEGCFRDEQFGVKVGLEAHNHSKKNRDRNSKSTEAKKSRKCPICGQMFASAYQLKCHTRMNAGQRLYKCSICDMGFIHCGSRSRHMRQSHPELLKFPCDECDMLFERQKALDQHKLSHSKEQEVTCNDCGLIFKSTREHFQHRRRVHRNTRYNCDVCGLHFPYPSKLKLHLMSKHNATKPFMCEICGSSFSEKNLLTTHKNIHSGEKKHECPTCGRRFLLKTTLSNHIQTHLDRKPHTCEVCGLGFKLSYYLKSHMKTHSQNRDRPHICSKCGTAFLKLAQLRNHERKHTGEKPYKCDICHALFSQLSSMKKHIKQIHEGLKPKDRFSCEYCGLSFTHSCKLKLHLMKHTGERPFACTVCGSTYRENHQLVTHMKIHDGSEPFKCSICECRFLQKSSLESHIRKHTGEKPFKCPICSQQFSHKGYLRDHIKVHDENRERKYKCSICDKAFTCSSHMRSHERLHLGEKPHKCDICGSRFTKRSSVKKHLKRTHGVQETAPLQVQDPLTENKTQETSKIQHVDVAHQGIHAEQQGNNLQGIQHEALRQTQVCPETHPEMHVDLPTELRPVLHVGIELQMPSEPHSSHLHPNAHPSMQTQGMFARLHAIHPTNHHMMHQHPSIHIVHPDMHPGAHASGHPQMEPQITPAISSSLCTHVHHPEIVQEMHVYTLAS